MPSILDSSTRRDIDALWDAGYVRFDNEGFFVLDEDAPFPICENE
jgi:hypothetical protein